MAEQRSRLSPRYGWDPVRHRYRDRQSGRFVPESVVQAAVDATLARTEREMQRLASRLMNRSLTVDEWQVAMATHLKTVHLVGAAAARGGWAQMSQADYGWTGSKVKEALRHLGNFATDLRSGKQLLNGTFQTRVGLYAHAGRGTHRAMQMRMAQQQGKTMYVNRLGPSDHCRDGAGRPGCIETTKAGWQPIGTLAPIGARHCLSRCRCRWEFR